MLKIEINTDNDTFAGIAGEECASILRYVANKLEEGYTDGPLVDYNGNTVGRFNLTSD